MSEQTANQQPTHLIIIRHGETQANADGRTQGRYDDPLTERGRRQVMQIARRLAAAQPRPTALYTSTLPRARTTAAAIARALDLLPVAVDELQELYFGQLENATMEELNAYSHTFTSLDDSYPGGESFRQFRERIYRAFERIVAAHPGERVIVVTHGGVTSTALALWSGENSHWRDFLVANCSYSEVVFSPHPLILCVGDCAHIQDELAWDQ